MNNFPIKHNGETYWVSRSMAVACFVFSAIDGRWCVLANQRGENAPDFQGYWNCPCGYLDYDETTAEAAMREVYEETGVKLRAVEFFGFNDSPDANRQNVTFRYYSIIHDAQPSFISVNTDIRGGETNEVQTVAWVPIDTIDNLEWAFGHDRIIKSLAHKLGLN